MHRATALAVLALTALGALAACSPGPSGAPAGTAGSALPTATGIASAPATGGPLATPPGQTETAWGRVWDAVPLSFPSIPGAQPVESGPEPVSAAFDLPAAAGGAADVAGTFVDALGAAGWSTTVDGPLEDGSIVVDGARAGTLCQARVQAIPLGGIVRLTVLYGASCPFA
ncbi:MAG TPA: hypothetical protein VMQ65_05100 [Candidatus Limnocylindria bacterium]|nr:hypothetical protein [Candidatus Limnocylindria bacterium]